MSQFRLPCTAYAVALVWRHRHRPTELRVSSHVFLVSGESPLLAEEMRDRAEREARKRWAEFFRSLPSAGTPDQWERFLWTGIYTVLGSPGVSS